MANFRCYDSQNIIQDSKERSLSVKRCTIQKCIEKDLQQYGTANPNKMKNLVTTKYNFNLVLRNNTNNKCLTNARSYDIKHDFLYPPTPLKNPKLNNLSAASGNTLKVVYPPTEIVYDNQNLTAKTWQNGVVDPKHTLFYNKCLNNYPNTNTTPTLTS